jgi:hypothetical protein
VRSYPVLPGGRAELNPEPAGRPQHGRRELPAPELGRARFACRAVNRSSLQVDSVIDRYENEKGERCADLCGEVIGLGHGLVKVHVVAVEKWRAADVSPPPRGSVREV